MSSKSHSSAETCWTCRIRKKKCDRKQPTCSACHSLDITCYNGNSRPSWIDGEVERDAFADGIKAQIREKAECRREKSYVKVLPLGRMRKPKVSTFTAGRLSRRIQSKKMIRVHEKSLAEPSSNGSTNDSLSPVEIEPADPALLGLSGDIDIDLEITFLDYAFPFLFPFYRPSIFKEGRGWLLGTLRKSMPLFHTAMGFSTYFFILVMTNTANGEHLVCQNIIEGKLISHVDNAIKGMRQGVEDLRAGHRPVSTRDKAHLMEDVIQLLVFETNISETKEWNVHLNAAVSLFKEILEQTNTKGTRLDLDSVLSMMQKPGWATENTIHRIWNPDQGAFLFHAAVIVFADIISATIVGDTPMLQEYHPLLINSESQSVKMEDFVGCQSWILLLIADIASLIEGKRERQISRNGLLTEGNRIAEELQCGITKLKVNLGKPTAITTCFHVYSNPEALQHTFDTNPFSLIWAHAKVLYLFVTTSGWQDEHEIVRENISSAIRLLETVSSPAIL